MLKTYTVDLISFNASGIMSTYDLLEHFQTIDNGKKLKDYENIPDAYINKNVFKDKRLNKLWTKAELAGFSSEYFSTNFTKKIKV